MIWGAFSLPWLCGCGVACARVFQRAHAPGRARRAIVRAWWVGSVARCDPVPQVLSPCRRLRQPAAARAAPSSSSPVVGTAGTGVSRASIENSGAVSRKSKVDRWID